MAKISFNLEKLAGIVNAAFPVSVFLFFLLGYFVSFWFHFLTVIALFLTLINLFYLHVQRKNTILANFGVLGQLRYLFESVGPEFRQYFFMSDTQERPFDRNERAEVYRKSKDIDSSSSFGTQLEYNSNEFKFRHSMYPLDSREMEKYSCIFGEERKLKNAYTIDKPFIIGAMSFGALGAKAVKALSRGAKLAGIPMNTGEGGFPKYHLEEGADLIFQLGTAKFGVRNEDGTLSDEKLINVVGKKNVKMVEIKLSQGAKPGKGGLLPKEKITDEIAELRGVPKGKDVISPPHHVECIDANTTVKFIKRVQDLTKLPVGIKLCLGQPEEFRELVKQMKKQRVYPDFITVDGAEGGTGAAPKGFMDTVGMRIFDSLPIVVKILKDEGIRDKLKVIACGKLVIPGKQMIAFCLGADAVYSSRGFMLSVGCIQALVCNSNKCPVGITTHDPKLQHGFDVELKAKRIANYVKNLDQDFYELLASTGRSSVRELTPDLVYVPGVNV